jgi:hypothetical protein
MARLLFIGNSFTARNDLPGLLQKLAAARGKVLEHRLISAGGASLRMHWNKGEARRAIEESKYDYVVLQEQSTLGFKNPVRMHENIRLFDEAIKASGARTVLYMTWARRNAPQTQQAITDAYVDIGRELGAIVVPVGNAWQDFKSRHDTPELYDKDLSHPTLAGSYLAACVFLEVLFKQSPVGIANDLNGITKSEIEQLQQAATLYSGSKKRRS